jgi:aldehyde dehydrogenase (NAD+)/betaine-aldehyde dehydrogenase
MSPTGIRPFWKNFIQGKWVEGGRGRTIPLENPATAEPLAEVSRAEVEDVAPAVEAARRAFDAGTLRHMRPAQRMDLLFRIAEELEGITAEIGLAECLDNGKRITDARNQSGASARYFRYYGGLADKLEGRTIPLGEGYLDYTLLEPYGVSAQVVPWNFPLQLAVRSLSCALATGNSVVIKAPVLCPLSVLLLGEACERAGVPEGSVNILCGRGGDVGRALVSHPGVDHVVFTGSVPTGQAILREAAERVIPSVMELGGKSAGVVYPDADLDAVAEDVMQGAFSNAGQICSILSRLIVHESVHDDLLERVVRRTEALSVGPGIEDHDVTPLISAGQLEKVEGLCRRAETEGAERMTGGRRVSRLPGHFFPPTVYGGVRPDMEIAREEVFGPVLAFLRFDTPDQAVRLANGTEFGLVAGVYTEDLGLAHWTAGRLVAGQVFVNEWFAGGVETPFGGTKRSGFGREKGQEALLNYVQTKNVAVRMKTP